MVRTREVTTCLIKYVNFGTKNLETMEQEVMLPHAKITNEIVGKMFGVTVVDVSVKGSRTIKYVMTDSDFYANANKEVLKIDGKDVVKQGEN